MSTYVFCITDMAFRIYRLLYIRVLTPTQFCEHIFWEMIKGLITVWKKKAQVPPIIHAHTNLCIKLHASYFFTVNGVRKSNGS